MCKLVCGLRQGCLEGISQLLGMKVERGGDKEGVLERAVGEDERAEVGCRAGRRDARLLAGAVHGD